METAVNHLDCLIGHHGRWGRGGCRRPGFKKGADGGCNSGDEKSGPNFWFSPEEKQTLKQVITTVREAAKTAAFEIGGATAGDCAGQTVEIAVRSSIRRAMIVQKTVGSGKGGKRQCKEKSEELGSSSSDDESESDNEKESVTTDNKQMRKKAKTAAKKVAKLTRKEVADKFGKVAGNWAAAAVRQSMMVSIMQTYRVTQKQQAKEARKSQVGDEQMEVSAHETPSASVIEEPSYVMPSADEIAINNAVQTFCDMGYKPDEWLLNHIREAKGDIPAVFEKLRGNNQ
jgi:hypothetical protein